MRAMGAAFAAAVLMVGVTVKSAGAQMILRAGPGVIVASDIDAPYDDVGPPLPPGYIPPPAYGPRSYGPPPPAYPREPYPPSPYGPTAYAPPVLSPGEIVRIARSSGYSPLGAPRQRGPVYSIGVIDLNGADGRLVIDARNGRILRFVPAYRYGMRGDEPVAVAYGQPSVRPPASMPAIGSHAAVPLPRPLPRAAAAPETTASLRAPKPANAQPAIPPAPTAALAAAPPASGPQPPVAAKPPVPAPQPTQPMPPAQGVE